MNVLVVTPLVPRERAPGAGAVVMHGELRAIAAHHDVTLATLAAAGDEADEAAVTALGASGIAVYSVERHRDRGASAVLRRAEIGARWRMGRLPLRTVVFHERAMQQTLDRLNGRPFDVVHVLDNAMAAYRLPRSAASVLTEYEVRLDASDGAVDGGAPRSTGASDAERRRWHEYQAVVWRRFDRIQLFTELDAAAVRQIAPEAGDRLRLNPFGVAVPPESEPGSERADALAFVGGFRHPPNVDAAVWLARDILPLVRARRPSAHLTIVGADPPAVVAELAGPAITVTGRVAEVEPYFAAAAVVVAPMRTGGGMRLKVLEAMAHARPVVTTTRGAAGIWNPSHAPTVRVADDADGIAAHVTALLESPADRALLGRRARAAVVEHHGWEAYARRLEALYAELPPLRAHG